MTEDFLNSKIPETYDEDNFNEYIAGSAEKAKQQIANDAKWNSETIDNSQKITPQQQGRYQAIAEKAHSTL